MDFSQFNIKEATEFLKFVVSSGGTFLIGVAAVIDMFRLKSLNELFSKARDARISVFHLIDSVRDVQQQIPELQSQVREIRDLGLGAKLDALTKAIEKASEDIKNFGKRLTEQERSAQLLSVSQQQAAPSVQQPSGEVLATPWDRVSNVWNDATWRLEQRLEQRLAGAHHKTVEKYDRTSRHNYDWIIHLGKDDSYIGHGTARLLTEINKIFKSWRSRPSATPVEVAKRVEALLSELDKELPPPPPQQQHEPEQAKQVRENT